MSQPENSNLPKLHLEGITDGDKSEEIPKRRCTPEKAFLSLTNKIPFREALTRANISLEPKFESGNGIKNENGSSERKFACNGMTTASGRKIASGKEIRVARRSAQQKFASDEIMDRPISGSPERKCSSAKEIRNGRGSPERNVPSNKEITNASGSSARTTASWKEIKNGLGSSERKIAFEKEVRDASGSTKRKTASDEVFKTASGFFACVSPSGGNTQHLSKPTSGSVSKCNENNACKASGYKATIEEINDPCMKESPAVAPNKNRRKKRTKSASSIEMHSPNAKRPKIDERQKIDAIIKQKEQQRNNLHQQLKLQQSARKVEKTNVYSKIRQNKDQYDRVRLHLKVLCRNRYKNGAVAIAVNTQKQQLLKGMKKLTKEYTLLKEKSRELRAQAEEWHTKLKKYRNLGREIKECKNLIEASDSN